MCPLRLPPPRSLLRRPLAPCLSPLPASQHGDRSILSRVTQELPAREIAEPQCLPDKPAASQSGPSSPAPARGVPQGAGLWGPRQGRGPRAERSPRLFPALRLESSGRSPAADGVGFNAVLSTFPLQGPALIQELIVLTLTCFNRSKVSINHFLVGPLITALC